MLILYKCAHDLGKWIHNYLMGGKIRYLVNSKNKPFNKVNALESHIRHEILVISGKVGF